MPGTKTALVEVALCVAERGDDDRSCPIPATPTTSPAVALAGARVSCRSRSSRGRTSTRRPRDAAAALPQLPVEPDRARGARRRLRRGRRVRRSAPAPPSSTTSPTATSSSTAARPASFLAEPGAREVGVELFSMSKSYGMAGWRLGFVVGNAELVARLEPRSRTHVRAGDLRAAAGGRDRRADRPAGDGRGAARALRGPPRPRRRRAPRCARSEGTFFVWLPLPDGLTVERLLDEARVARRARRGLRPSRRRPRPPLARGRRTRRSTRVSSGFGTCSRRG